MLLYSLDQLDGELGGRKVIGQRMLMHMQCGQTQRQLRLQFGRKALLVDIVATLHIQIVQCVQIALCQLGG